MRRTLYMLLAVLSLSSCSVKEDRTDCPVLIRFSDRVNPFGVKSNAEMVLADASGNETMTAIDVGRLSDSGFYLTAPKGRTAVSVITTSPTVQTDGSEAWFKDDLQPECIYALGEEFVTAPGDEEYMVRDSLCRQLAPAVLHIQNPDSSPCTYEMVLCSNWSGFDRKTLRPLAGELSFPLVSTDGGWTYEFNIPRQGDDSLVILMSENGVVIYAYPLGADISSSGYDWTEAQLDEIRLGLNYFSHEFVAVINDWTVERQIEYEF